jgi:hypothetical protein
MAANYTSSSTLPGFLGADSLLVCLDDGEVYRSVGDQSFDRRKRLVPGIKADLLTLVHDSGFASRTWRNTHQRHVVRQVADEECH